MEKKIKIVSIVIGALMAAAIIFGICYAVWEQTYENIATKYEKYSDIMAGEGLLDDSEATPSEYYICDVSQLNASNIFVWFHNGKYVYYLGTEEVSNGSFTMDKNVAKIKYNITNGTEADPSVMDMVVDGNKLFFTSAIYCGDSIPSAKTFDAVVSRRSSNNEAYQYTFHEDGSYELVYGQLKGKAELTTIKGHYSANDDGTVNRSIISNVDGTETDTLPLYIYKGHLVDSFYTSITAEEYLAYTTTNE